MATLIVNGFPVFLDTDGTPVDEGYIYIGEDGLNPITNPVSVYWDEDLTVPASNIRTRGGYPVYQGSPGRLYVANAYSLIVQDKYQRTIYYQPSSSNGIGQISLGDDSTFIENDGGVLKVSIGSAIEANGDVFEVTALMTPTGSAAAGAYLFFDPSSNTFAWSAVAGTLDATKRGLYDGSGRRQCRFRLLSATTWEETVGATITTILSDITESIEDASRGLDLTYVELDGGVVKVSIGSRIEANGSIFTVSALMTPSGSAVAGAYLFYEPSGSTFAWSTTPGTYDPTKGGFYNVGGQRQCRFRLRSSTTWEVLGDIRDVFRTGTAATYTAPKTGRYRVQVFGGGGGGGGCGVGVASSCGGGGSGSYSAITFYLEEGDTLTYTVGAGGAGGAGGGTGTTGGAGSQSTCTDGVRTASAAGALGGVGGNNVGTAGGVAFHHETDEAEPGVDGQDGGAGTVSSTSGRGGYGPGCKSAPGVASGNPGGNGTGYGGGASGGSGASQPGGDGAAGAVIIELLGSFQS